MRLRNLLCLLFAFIGLLPLRAWSCSCVGPTSPSEAVRGALAVFHGRVLSSGEKSAISYAQLVRFKVLGSWKGPTEPEITLHTGWGGGDCGFAFEEGGEYLVYAYPSWWAADNDSTRLMAHICSRTQRIEAAGEDLKYLEAGSTRVEGRLRHFSPGFLSCATAPEGLWPAALLALLGRASRRRRTTTGR